MQIEKKISSERLLDLAVGIIRLLVSFDKTLLSYEFILNVALCNSNFSFPAQNFTEF